MSANMVLSDELLVCYENYPQDIKQYKKRYNKLIAHFTPPYMTNLAQLKRCKSMGLNETCYRRLVTTLASRGDTGISLEQLAKSTRYQFILTLDDSQIQLPYVNIKKQNVQQLYTVICQPQQSRQYLLRHIEALCENAQKVLICDNYFAANWENTQRLFSAILPRKPLRIEYVETAENLPHTARNSTMITDTFAKGIFADWQVRQTDGAEYQGRHDRYLLIDNKMELMFSSGFDYLWNDSKELTCVFRQVI